MGRRPDIETSIADSAALSWRMRRCNGGAMVLVEPIDTLVETDHRALRWIERFD